MGARKRRVTSVDVAREAGVSQATVSYVLNDAPDQKISEETRRSVLAAVERLGYTPSAAARTLRRGRSDIVLLILPDVPVGPALAEWVEDLTDELDRHGLAVISRRARGDARIPALWRDLVPVAVVALSGTLARHHAEEMRAAGVYVAGVLLEADGQDVLSLPQNRIGRVQAGHLADTGHRLLGYAAPDDRRVRRFYELRLDGVRRECAERGLTPPAVREVPLDVEPAVAAVRAWRSAGVTGVCAYNDEVAFALLAGARAAGVSVPGDLAVIGVDDIPLAPFAVPPLTTVDQHAGSLARGITDVVLAGIGRRQPVRPRGEAITLVVRASA